MATIRGVGHQVFINKELLKPAESQKLINHSPDGFNWGYGGSGPSQLALALLLRYTGNMEFSVRHYMDFKWDIVANLPQGDFLMDDEIIKVWIKEKQHGIR